MYQAHDDLLDNGPQYLKDHCTEVTLCSGTPDDYTKAHTTNMLSTTTVDSADFTVANGDVSGRKVTLGQQTGVSIAATGTITHICFSDVAAVKLLLVLPTASRAVEIGDTVTIPATDYEVLDPAAA